MKKIILGLSILMLTTNLFGWGNTTKQSFIIKDYGKYEVPNKSFLIACFEGYKFVIMGQQGSSESSVVPVQIFDIEGHGLRCSGAK